MLWPVSNNVDGRNNVIASHRMKHIAAASCEKDIIKW